MRAFFVRLAAGLALMGAAPPANAAQADHWNFGALPDGRQVHGVTLSNRNGVSAAVIAYGATLQRLVLPDRAGKSADITLGYNRLSDYLDTPQYFGSSVGRVANRIARGRFTLDGKSYQVPVNNGANALHGGTTGFDKVLWEVVEAKADEQAAEVTLRYVSPDGEMGFPGRLIVTVTYRLDEANALTIDYRATSDRPTVANITNHAYWNLGGEGSAAGAMSHVLTIPADSYLPVDAGLIPTGEFRPVEGTPFDFRTPHVIGERVRDARDRQIAFGRGYDHNFVIGRAVTPDLHLMAKVDEPTSGRGFELWSNQPGLQFYSGNFLDGTSSGKSRRIYREGDAIALEPQTFPDTVNQPAFGSARLDPGQEYRNVMVYKFTPGSAAKPVAGGGSIFKANGTVSDGFGRLTSVRGKKQVACPRQDERTAVLLMAGQSNGANTGEKAWQARHGTRVVNWAFGKCWQASSPLLGTENIMGESWTLTADKLIDAGLFDRVILIPANIGGTEIARWQAGGDLNAMLLDTVKTVRSRYRITHVLWHQGESDRATPGADYAARFQSLIASLRGEGVTAPVFVSIATHCGGSPGDWPEGDDTVAATQRALPDHAQGIFAGIDSNRLVPVEDRYDHCHFNAAGQEKFAGGWVDAVRNAQSADSE